MYVYPECIKDVVRAILDEKLRDYQDPEGAAGCGKIKKSFVTVNSY